MPFYSERKRLAELAKQEAAGENLWTDIVSSPLRNKIARLINPIENEINSSRRYDNKIDIFSTARALLARDLGVDYLYSGSSYPDDDMKEFLQNCDHVKFPDALEVLYMSIQRCDHLSRQHSLESIFENEVNELLESYRVNYSLENGIVTSFEDREIHKNVVQPTLSLVAKKSWKKVETPYIKAIHEIADGNPDDAITDATTALQEALRFIGCKGKDFNALVKSAKSSFLKGADTKYIDAIDKLVDWASAARVNLGDIHKTTEPTKDDAWFVVHTVGVLILYLSKKFER